MMAEECMGVTQLSALVSRFRHMCVGAAYSMHLLCDLPMMGQAAWPLQVSGIARGFCRPLLAAWRLGPSGYGPTKQTLAAA